MSPWDHCCVARDYRPVDREQEFLLPPSMTDWLPDDHLVWFVIEAVQRLDTTAFHAKAKRGGVGRRGYHPVMLLTLFVYAMAHGVSSSRRIERLCATDVAFRIVCAQDIPDHTVLARFRQNHEAALTDLLTESLVLAAHLGMVSLGVVAFDGTKIAANASRDANRGEAHLRKLAEEFVAATAATDTAEDALFGQDKRGDEPPPGMDRSNRGGRITEALDELAARRDAEQEIARGEDERARAYEDKIREGVGRAGRPPRGVDKVEVARARWERQLRYARERDRRRGPGGRAVPPEQHCRVRVAREAYDAAVVEAEQAAAAKPDTAAQSDAGGEKFIANLTDPQSRLLKTRNGWVQGYNCQTATSEDGFFVSARATQDANDLEQFVPTKDAVLEAVELLVARTGREDLEVGTMIGDAGYDSDANLEAKGPDRLIADAKGRVVSTRAVADPAVGDPAEDASEREKMNHRLRTEDGVSLYRQRGHMVEAPNAWLKDRRGLVRFARRGLVAVQAELSFAAAVTNLLKMRSNGATVARLRTV
jgi:transposase